MRMARQVRYQDRIVPERKKARVQAPESMVKRAAVQENNGWLTAIKGLAAACGKYLFTVYFEVHQANFFAALNPFSKSALMSSGRLHPPLSGRTPRRVKAAEIFAVSAATRMSQPRARSIP